VVENAVRQDSVLVHVASLAAKERIEVAARRVRLMGGGGGVSRTSNNNNNNNKKSRKGRSTK
jgi:hypothetical protein